MTHKEKQSVHQHQHQHDVGDQKISVFSGRRAKKGQMVELSYRTNGEHKGQCGDALLVTLTSKTNH